MSTKSYEQWLASLSPELRVKWSEAADHFKRKFVDEAPCCRPEDCPGASYKHLCCVCARTEPGYAYEHDGTGWVRVAVPDS